MNDAETIPLMTDDRERAALLWDEPALRSRADIGSRQWHSALQLQFIDFGALDDHDILSTAAHVVFAALSGDQPRSNDLRAGLRAAGRTGELFERLVGLGFSLDNPEADRASLALALTLVLSLADADLRARLLVRLVAYGELRGARDLSRGAAEHAVADTSASTRLGVVARRWATRYGIEVPNFSPWSSSDTPEDSLLVQPWIQSAVIDAVASMAADRFEKGLAGIWDGSFHAGRTKFDDLLAAHAQAEWCGAIDLRSNIRKLLVTDILNSPERSPDQVRWGLIAWASEPSAKRVAAAILRAERHLDATGATELLASVRLNPGVGDEARIEVAAGVWNILDDAAADDLLTWLPMTGPDQSATRHNVISALLWRRPTTWTSVFAAADARVRNRMLAALGPHDVVAAPDDLLPILRAYAAEAALESGSGPLAAALRFITTGVPVDDADQIGPVDALQLLDWNSDAVAPEVVATLTAKLADAARARLQEATGGKFGFGSHDIDQTLGRLASYLPTRPREAIETLVATCGHPAAPAGWQFGALEGLVALRRARLLTREDVLVVGELQIAPGRNLLGDQMSAEAIRANQLRVIAPDVDDDDVAWLAVCARGTDVKGRLVAMAALGSVSDGCAAVDWSLVGGLFDPDDDVVVRAVASIGHRGLSADSGAVAVATSRLVDLAATASAGVRREVVVTAVNRSELDLRDLIDRARHDRAWTVRREAEVPPGSLHSGEAHE